MTHFRKTVASNKNAVVAMVATTAFFFRVAEA
jgi:hypothetical protein